MAKSITCIPSLACVPSALNSENSSDLWVKCVSYCLSSSIMIIMMHFGRLVIGNRTASRMSCDLAY